MFNHEKLNVYQKALKFIHWTTPILKKVSKQSSVVRQLDRASTSILLNIAEGNGKYTSKDRCKFFDISRGSALECAACLDAFIAREELKEEEIREGKVILEDIVNMLVGLVKSNSDRVFEGEVGYGGESD